MPKELKEKIIEILRKKEKEFQKKYPPQDNYQIIMWQKGIFMFLKENEEQIADQISELFQAQREEIIEIVNKVKEIEPESNGRFNACNEIINKLKQL